MTKAEMRTAVRSLVAEAQTDVGALFPSDNVMIDFFIDSALELVVMDLADLMPHRFRTSENVSLTANVAYATLSAEYLQILAVERNVTSKNPRPIEIVEDINDLQNFMYVGETKDEPRAVYFDATKIYFAPTPSTTTASWLKVWGIAMEAATMAVTGPAYLPRPAHRLVVFKALELIAAMDESNTTKWYIIYNKFLKQVERICGSYIQAQPRFIKGSHESAKFRDDRDPTTFDTRWPD
jgi:hypothetical protein